MLACKLFFGSILRIRCRQAPEGSASDLHTYALIFYKGVIGHGYRLK